MNRPDVVILMTDQERAVPPYESPAVARWRRDPLRQGVADAVQDVFLDCLRPGGALERADPARGTFRIYLHGIVRNVALRHERVHRRLTRSPEVPADLPPIGWGGSIESNGVASRLFVPIPVIRFIKDTAGPMFGMMMGGGGPAPRQGAQPAPF